MLKKAALIFVYSIIISQWAFTSVFTFSKNKAIKLSKSVLDTPILMRSVITPQTVSSEFETNESRIVVFKKQGRDIYLFELTDGHQVATVPKSQILLAKLPIISELKSSITIDFNDGLSRLFKNYNLNDSEFMGKIYYPERFFSAELVENSYLEKAENSNGVSVIEQIVQINDMAGYFPSYNVKYYFSPYRPNENFTPIEHKNYLNIGFYESRAKLTAKKGDVKSYITHWHIGDEPIVFYISRNTPSVYRSAIKEGVLYWNKAFGKEVLQVKLAPANATAPHHSMNIIQWIDNDEAEVALADATHDPNNGEITQAQIYMPSSFILSTTHHMRRFLRNFEEHGEKAHEHDDSAAEADSNTKETPHHLCKYSVKNHMQRALTKISTLQGVTDETMQELSKDYIRGTIAHEVGHTLGLKHNFAGKLSADISLESRDKLFEKLAKNEPIKNFTDYNITSTVMDYLDYEDTVLTGRKIKESETALDYDHYIIQWAYGNEPRTANTQHAYCNDYNQGTVFADCAAYNYGDRPITFHNYQMGKLIDDLHSYILESFLAAKATEARDIAMPIETVRLNPTKIAHDSALHLFKMLQWLSTDTRSLAIETQFPHNGPTNRKEIIKMQHETIMAQVEELGGAEDAFFSWMPLVTEEGFSKFYSIKELVLEKLEKSLKEQNTRGFVGEEGKLHNFTPEEVSHILDDSKKFLDLFSKEFLAQQLNSILFVQMNITNSVDEYPDSNSLNTVMEGFLFKVAREILFRAEIEEETRTISGQITQEDGSVKEVTVDRFLFSYETRMKAVMMLTQPVMNSLDWAKSEKKLLLGNIVHYLESKLQTPIDKIYYDKLSKPLVEWVMEFKEIVKILKQDDEDCENFLKSIQDKPPTETTPATSVE